MQTVDQQGAVHSGGSLSTSLATILTETACLERDALDRETAHALDRLLSRLASVERYRIIRKYVRGLVVDAACGTGYGSWILSKCPAVSGVVGLDRDPATIERARVEFPECEFRSLDFASPRFEQVLRSLRPETVVCVETLEHLSVPDRFFAALLSSSARRFVATFPSFPTTAFNPYHLQDWTLSELNDRIGRVPIMSFVIDDAVSLAVYDL